MNRYSLYLLLIGILLMAIAYFIIRRGLKTGTFYLMGAQVTKKNNTFQYWMIIAFHSIAIGGFGLLFTYFGLFKK